MEEGEELPSFPEDEFYLGAFYALSTCRPLGFGGAGSIPWRDVVAYSDRHGLDPDVALAFPVVIRAMDQVWLEWQRQEIDRQRRHRTGEEGSGAFGKG